MRVLAVTADASLQVALASMMPDWELQALSDASGAMDAGDAAVALVDLGTTARGLEAARALTLGLQIPCVVIGEDGSDDDIARIVVRPFTLSELGEAVTRAAADGLTQPAAEAHPEPEPTPDPDPEPEAEPAIQPPPNAEQEPQEQEVEEPEPAPQPEPVAELDLPEPVAELDLPEPEVEEPEPAPQPEPVAEQPPADPVEEATHELAPVLALADARAPHAEQPEEGFREAFAALADIAALPIEAATEPTPDVVELPDAVVDDLAAIAAEITPDPEPEPAPDLQTLLLEELGNDEPIAPPQPPSRGETTKTVDYVRALLAEIDAQPEPLLAGARVVRERAPRPAIRTNIVPDPVPAGRRGLRRRKPGPAVTKPVQPQPQQGILGRLSVALWAARDLEALLQEMPVLGEPRTVAHAFLAQVVELLGPETAAVYVARPDGSWGVLAPHGLSQVEAGMHVAADQPLFHEVTTGSNGVFIAPVDLAQGLVAGIGGARTETLMAVPLEAGGQSVAVVVVGGAAFTESDLSRLCEMACEGAPGLAFALLMERLRARL